MIKVSLILATMTVASSAWFMPSFGYGSSSDSTNIDENFKRDSQREVVIDKLHSKVYYDAKPTKKMHFFEAWDYCKNITFDGYNDWRVMSKEEAVSLLELSRPKTTVKHAFKNVQKEKYWTATQDRYDEAWYVDFDLGRYSTKKETYKYRTICVRDEKM